MGIELTLGKNSFQIDSDDLRWGGALEVLRSMEIRPKTETQFSKNDLRSAIHLDMYGTGHTGYPQPEDNFGYGHYIRPVKLLQILCHRYSAKGALPI